jgi:hypothetical protein
MPNPEHDLGDSQQLERWSQLGKTIAENGPHAQYVPDPLTPPVVFENGLEQIRYQDAFGNLITLPALDKMRRRLPTPASIIKARRQERLSLVGDGGPTENVVAIFPGEALSTAADNS